MDAAAAFARRTTIVHDWDDASQVKWVDSTGIDLVRGHARLTGERTVAVETPDGSTVELRAKHAVTVSTGQRRPASRHPWPRRHRAVDQP